MKGCIPMKLRIYEGMVKCRIARWDEFDNGRVIWHYEKMDSQEAEELARQKSLKYPEDIFYVKYDDIMNPTSGYLWKNGKRYNSYEEITESKKVSKKKIFERG